MITTLAHTLSTIGLGVIIGMIGLRLSDTYETLAHLVAPLMLLAMGLLYLSIGLQRGNHRHFPNSVALQGKTKTTVIFSLGMTMFFSPCFEIETYFLAAVTFGWRGIGLLSAVYLGVTLTGITLMVWGAYHSLHKFQWHWLEHHEKKVTGSVLIGLGITSFFIQ